MRCEAVNEPAASPPVLQQYTKSKTPRGNRELCPSERRAKHNAAYAVHSRSTLDLKCGITLYTYKRLAFKSLHAPFNVT